MNGDKQIELNRYDTRARDILADGYSVKSDVIYSALAFPPVLRAPYIFYEHCISRNVSKEHDVLELGSGTGMHTYALVKTGARVVASDISANSLEVLSRRFNRERERERVKTQVADMEMLPFDDNTFDVVTSAGSLSYGDPVLVDAEIRRVLRPGGLFICVDSLNHNPVYRLNRWLHYKKGDRTRSTMLRMPTLARIESVAKGFKDTDVQFFGAVSYIMPILARIIGQDQAAKVSDIVDRLVRVRRAAFKFVLVAKGRL